MPESSAIVTAPVPAAAARALPSAFSTNVSPSSGGSSNSARQHVDLVADEQARELAALVLVVGGQQELCHEAEDR